MKILEEINEMLAEKADDITTAKVIDIDAPMRIKWIEAQINALVWAYELNDFCEVEVALIAQDIKNQIINL